MSKRKDLDLHAKLNAHPNKTLARKAANLLLNDKIESVEQIRMMGWGSLMRIPGLGHKTAKVIEEAIGGWKDN